MLNPLNSLYPQKLRDMYVRLFSHVFEGHARETKNSQRHAITLIRYNFANSRFATIFYAFRISLEQIQAYRDRQYCMVDASYHNHKMLSSIAAKYKNFQPEKYAFFIDLIQI